MEAETVLAPDIISNLPLNVVECILMCLPLRDAVRTSILSQKWRYKWVSIPELVFDDTCVPNSSGSLAVIRNKFVNFVDRVLLLHRGPIQKFKLSVSYLQSIPDIDQWLLYLSWREVKELSIELEEKEWLKVPSCLFSCQHLTHLELFRCEVRPPPTFKGFSSLKSLSLQQSFFEGGVIENLLPSCPHLESFSLAYFDTLSLTIRAPNLKYLRLEGEFKDLCLENTPLLATVSIALYMTEEISEHLEQTTICNMINALGSVPLLERLVAESYFVKHLSVNKVPRRLPIKYERLKTLELYQVGFEDVNEISVAICLIVNSPNLEELLFSASSDSEACMGPDMDYWETQHPLDCSFKRLQNVNMTDISGVADELEFIKFLLAKSPVLKTMSIKPSIYVVDGGWEMLIEMLRFPRASVQAGIIYHQD
ncbi:hypothetical protein AQUCO_00201009v1 [Aquilegia coerulea]|uniref:FBD domain-containing protein n=1 Tax=Aquilegia coerulea TaxID=218851 RepID=A0A2G5F623_AQUCA|nr:hypothetical protein AQUCO_00201009v1 [Aquilegia coerulea]PIA63376.1 hypothetical protein AQUCO_00201009v1 [Aquilegia coerulea]